MGIFVKLAEDKYVEWSGVTDSPTSSILTFKDVEDQVYSLEERKYSRRDLEDEGELGQTLSKAVKLAAEARLERLRTLGTTSAIGDNLESLLRFNRAGPNETHLKTVEEIIEAYTFTAEKKGKWPFS
jgi:hypothetical protein